MKGGVRLGDFFSHGVSQLNLFDEFKPQLNSEALMQVIDRLNSYPAVKIWGDSAGGYFYWRLLVDIG